MSTVPPSSPTTSLQPQSCSQTVLPHDSPFPEVTDNTMHMFMPRLHTHTHTHIHTYTRVRLCVMYLRTSCTSVHMHWIMQAERGPTLTPPAAWSDTGHYSNRTQDVYVLRKHSVMTRIAKKGGSSGRSAGTHFALLGDRTPAAIAAPRPYAV
jgi:hypothetical protein